MDAVQVKKVGLKAWKSEILGWTPWHIWQAHCFCSDSQQVVCDSSTCAVNNHLLRFETLDLLFTYTEQPEGRNDFQLLLTCKGVEPVINWLKAP